MTNRQSGSVETASRHTDTGSAPANHSMGGSPARYFLSCDWGTTSFRLRLVETGTLRVVGELKNNEGIAATFQLWQGTGKPASERLAFYRSTLETQIVALQVSLRDAGAPINLLSIPSVTGLPAPATLSDVSMLSGVSKISDVNAISDVSSLSGIPLILSGMASSSIGMQELPYKALPFNINGQDLQVAIFEATDLYPHKTLLLSGVRSTDDVMRGEETQLIGCFPLGTPGQPPSGKSQGDEERIFIFPGTHSKHVRVRNSQVVGLKTYMTGEYFHLLTRHSILAGSVTESIDPSPSVIPAPVSPPAAAVSTSNPFASGVLDSLDSNLLHQSFQIRTHHLLGTMSKEDNYHYLSGLLIGSECKDLLGTCLPLALVAGGDLLELYSQALQTLAITAIQIQDPDQAVIKAHAHLCKSFLGK